MMKRYRILPLLLLLLFFVATVVAEEEKQDASVAEEKKTEKENAESCDASTTTDEAAAAASNADAKADAKQEKKPPPAKKRTKLRNASFRFIEQAQLKSERHKGDFGRFLDAGTGVDSLTWLASIIHSNTEYSPTAGDVSLESYVAITADTRMKERTDEAAIKLNIADKGDIVIGNWITGVDIKTGKPPPGGKNGDYLLRNDTEKFDTILADYLIGAVDKFSPYFQDAFFERLVPDHLKPGGRLYVIGLEPIPDEPSRSNKALVVNMKHARDACVLLAGKRPYREYPLSWIERNLARIEGLTIIERRILPLEYNHEDILTQLNIGREMIEHFPSEDLKKGMAKALDELEAESLRVTRASRGGKFLSGYNYAVVAEMAAE